MTIILKEEFILLITTVCIAFACEDDNASTNCYSPSQNLEMAYEDGAQGCACDVQNDQDVCIKDKSGREVALICENGKWIAVEDGPCMP